MLGKVNHIAIAVPDLEAAAAQYRGTLGARVGVPQPEPDHGVTVVFIELPKFSTLLQPLPAIVPLQLFACELATLKGHDVDQPRNLAKSVTVE